MKLFNILLIALVAFSFVQSLRRKVKFDEEFDVWIRIDSSSSGNEEYQAKAKRADVMDEKKAKPLGLYFYGLKSVSNIMAKALVKDGSDYYLPYRIVTGEWKATQADKTSRDFVQTTIQVGNASHTFKLKVDYNTFSRNPVTYEELKNYASVLHKRSGDARTEVTGLVSVLEKHAEDYILQMNSIEASKKGIDGFNDNLKENESKLKAAVSDQEAKKTELKQVQDQIDKALKELSDFRLKEEAVTSSIQKNEQLMKTLNTVIADLKTSISTKSTDSKQFEDKANKAKKDWEGNSKILESKAPNFDAPKFIKEATDSFGKKDLKGVKENLAKILA